MSGPGAPSLYVHAPFCARRCVYCDFAVAVRRTGDLDGWVAALAAELAAVVEDGRIVPAPVLDTLYVGGGTPSLLGPGAMDALAGVLGRDRLADPGLEWTAEANPESFTPEVARAWRRAGVNRLSVGVQSFEPSVLRWMGRLHGPEGAARAVETARDAGIEDLSVDLVFGLPVGVERDWRRDLDRVLDLDVPHVSLYGLTVEPGTRLGRWVAEGRERPSDEARYEDEYLAAAERLSDAGYEHYEVSNFARPGHRSRHNLAYWEGVPYLGLGNGAHSYLHPLRRWNLRGWDAYRGAMAEGALPVEGEEVLDASRHGLERTWLGLRTDRGIDLAGLPGPARDLARGWAASGLAACEGGRVRLTARGWLVLDRLAVDLDARTDATSRRG